TPPPAPEPSTSALKARLPGLIVEARRDMGGAAGGRREPDGADQFARGRVEVAVARGTGNRERGYGAGRADGEGDPDHPPRAAGARRGRIEEAAADRPADLRGVGGLRGALAGAEWLGVSGRPVSREAVVRRGSGARLRSLVSGLCRTGSGFGRGSIRRGGGAGLGGASSTGAGGGGGASTGGSGGCAASGGGAGSSTTGGGGGCGSTGAGATTGGGGGSGADCSVGLGSAAGGA